MQFFCDGIQDRKDARTMTAWCQVNCSSAFLSAESSVVLDFGTLAKKWTIISGVKWPKSCNKDNDAVFTCLPFLLKSVIFLNTLNMTGEPQSLDLV